jgi:hypothetical protein
MSGSRAVEDVQVNELTEQQAAEVFDGICRRELGMSGPEFLRRWDAGQYAGVDVDSVDGLPDVTVAIPLVR